MRLVEREFQLGDVDRALAESRRGCGGVVLASGGPASGRTRFLDTVVERAQRAGVTCLVATGSVAEHTLRLGLLSQLLNSADLPAEVLSTFDESALAMTRRIASGTGERDGGEAPGIDEGMVLGLHTLVLSLIRLSEENPLLIAVDNVHHADRTSLTVLLHVVRRIRTSRIVVVMSDDAEPDSRTRAFHAELSRLPNLTRLRLCRLSRSGVRELLVERLGERVAEKATNEVYAASGGNPELVRALLDDVEESGQAREHGYGLALISCLHRSSLPLVAVGRAVALVDQRCDVDVLAQICRLPAEVVERSLRQMEKAGMLHHGRLRHPVGRAAVLDELDSQHRAHAHAIVADLLHEQGDPAARVAAHLVEAAPGTADEGWRTQVLREAADEALMNNDAPFAVRCLARAQDLAPDEARADIGVRLAHAEWQTNPTSAARRHSELLAAVRAGYLDNHDAPLLVRQLVWHGRLDDARAVLETLRDAHESSLQLRHMESWLALTVPRLARPPQTPGTVSGRGLAFGHDPVLGALGEVTGLHPGTGANQIRATAERVLARIQPVQTTAWAEEVALIALTSLVHADRADVADSWAQALLARGTNRRMPVWIALMNAVRAHVALRQSRFAAAAELAEAALEALPRRCWGIAVGLPLGTLVMARTRMGDLVGADRALMTPVPVAVEQSRYGLHLSEGRAFHALAGGDPHAALAEFLDIGERMREWTLDHSEVIAWRVGAAECWARLGNWERATALGRAQLENCPDTDLRTRARALRLMAGGAPIKQQLPMLEQALALFERVDDRFGQAQVLRELSVVHHTMNQDRLARRLARRGTHLTAMCGAAGPEPGAVCADSGTLSEDEHDPLRSLTDRERRVAALAVMGYTNREIAEMLFVTPSTVEQHLTRTYKKLQIRHRRDLPVELAAAKSAPLVGPAA